MPYADNLGYIVENPLGNVLYFYGKKKLKGGLVHCIVNECYAGGLFGRTSYVCIKKLLCLVHHTIKEIDDMDGLVSLFLESSIFLKEVQRS